ncbi:hypothetical protein [Terricaulis sp.]|uniref:hypothetical protein n=1 Tax=Terricaulis sp. TaxID=2768686 RepID=UPI00378380C5
MEPASGLLHPIFLIWAVWMAFVGVFAIVRAKRSAREDTMFNNSPVMFVVTGLLMLGMLAFAIATGGFR